jgi:hypothetical protein
MKTDELASSELRELVQRFRVCWKTWPEYIYSGHERRQIGYELELAGTHEFGLSHPEPGCEHCQHVFFALRQIATYILPRQKRASMYEIGPFDQAIRYSGLHSNRPDIVLKLKILHRNGYDQPVDECEDRCLREVEQSLRELGVGHISWTDHNNAGPGRQIHSELTETRY